MGDLLAVHVEFGASAAVMFTDVVVIGRQILLRQRSTFSEGHARHARHSNNTPVKTHKPDYDKIVTKCGKTGMLWMLKER